MTFTLLFHSFPFMSVVKIHTDDLQAIYDILGDLLARKQGRPSAKDAEDLRSRATASQNLLRTMLGIPVTVSEPSVEPTLEPAEELTVEEVVAAIGDDITPEPVVEGDEAEA